MLESREPEGRAVIGPVWPERTDLFGRTDDERREYDAAQIWEQHLRRIEQQAIFAHVMFLLSRRRHGLYAGQVTTGRRRTRFRVLTL